MSQLRVSKEVYLVLASRAVRTFPYGYLSVILPIYLASTGSSTLLGLFFTLSAASSVAALLLLSIFGHKVNIRSAVVVQLLLFSTAMMVMVLYPSPLPLLIAAIISTANWAPGGGSGTGAGAYNTSLNILLSEKTDSDSRTFSLSLSAILGTLAFAAGSVYLGIVGVGTTGLKLQPGFSGNLGLDSPLGYFLLAILAQFVAVGMISLVSSRRGTASTVPTRSHEGRSPMGHVIRESLRFIVAESCNGFGSGLFQRFVPLWFFLRFNIGVTSVAAIFAVAGVITAFLTLSSRWVELRLGAANSVFASRVGFGVSLLGLAIAPTLPVALAIYYASLVVSRVSAPIQQSFVFASIPSADWTRANSTVATSFAFANTIGPLIGAFLLLNVNLDLPFFVAFPFFVLSGLVYGFSFRRSKIAPAEHGEADPRAQGATPQ